jgi:hypothetical protein
VEYTFWEVLELFSSALTSGFWTPTSEHSQEASASGELEVATIRHSWKVQVVEELGGVFAPKGREEGEDSASFCAVASSPTGFWLSPRCLLKLALLAR